MKIVKIEPFIVNAPLREKFYFSQWHYDERTICLVRITTDDGTYGWGEGYGPAPVVKAGIDFFTPYLLDENPIGQEELWQRMYLRSLDYARKGVMLASLSALDIALWDLRGKVFEQPVSMLLGGRKREYVRAYATGLYFRDTGNLANALANEAVLYKEQGFSAIKMKVGLGLKRDRENIEAVRKAIGPDIELMVDANHAYSFREALRLALEIEQYDISWFEEPVSPDSYECYVDLRSRTTIPIAGGECEYLRAGFLQLFKPRCIDIAQPDVCAAGGLTEVKKILSLAQVFGVDFIPHTWGSGIGFAASLHLQANQDIMPGRLFEPEPLIEMDRTENPLRDELIVPKFKNDEGRIRVPDCPGLGVDVDVKKLNTYLVE